MKRALISVSDKSGIAKFAEQLSDAGYVLLSTGGTAETLENAGLKVSKVETITGFKEFLDGRVKTLHPAVHGGILADRENSEHMSQTKELNIDPIDIVVVNLYPFKATVLSGAPLAEIIENIDIGGPTMIRAAAKNHKYTMVVTDTSDYTRVIDHIKSGNEDYALNYELAGKAFEHTANYDAMISRYFQTNAQANAGCTYKNSSLTLSFDSGRDLRYGENPHQSARYYKDPFVPEDFLQILHGRDMSYCNYNDLTGAINLVDSFERPAVVAVKHACPCGVAEADSDYEAYINAYNADPLSIFGGIVAFNTTISQNTAEEMSKTMLHIVYAPDFEPEAIKILKSKKNLIIIKGKKIENELGVFQKTRGGILYQDSDSLDPIDSYEIVTEKKPSERELQDLRFAMKVCTSAKSNAIVIAKNLQTIGIGQGQVSRVFASKSAVGNAVLPIQGAVLASDAFFPFEDALKLAVESGVTAVIQPGGSVNDQKIIDYANNNGIAMVITGRRHFKHGY